MSEGLNKPKGAGARGGLKARREGNNPASNELKEEDMHSLFEPQVLEDNQNERGANDDDYNSN